MLTHISLFPVYSYPFIAYKYKLYPPVLQTIPTFSKKYNLFLKLRLLRPLLNGSPHSFFSNHIKPLLRLHPRPPSPPLKWHPRLAVHHATSPSSFNNTGHIPAHPIMSPFRCTPLRSVLIELDPLIKSHCYVTVTSLNAHWHQCTHTHQKSAKCCFETQALRPFACLLILIRMSH